MAQDKMFLSQMIGIIVAFVVLGAVLVPICNSLSSDNDGGSGQSDDPGNLVMLNDMREMFADIGVSTDITGYEMYAPSITPTLPEPIHITLDDLYDYQYLFSRTEVDQRIAGMSIFELNDDDTLNMGNIELTLNGDSYQPSVFIAIGVDSAVGEYLGDITDFDIMVQTDYTYTMRYTNNVNYNVELEGVASYVKMFSEEENVWTHPYVYSNYESTPYMKVTDGSYLMVAFEIYGDTSVYSYQSVRVTSQMLEQGEMTFTGKVMYDGVEYTLQATYSDIIATSEPGVYEIDYSADISTTVISPSDASGDLEYYAYFDLVSAMNADPIGNGSGGSSSGGIMDTIIRIIPVFVAVALILGIMGMFYQNRKEL